MSGSAGSVVDSGSGGAKETALASIRCGNSKITAVYCKFGKSGEAGEAHPL